MSDNITIGRGDDRNFWLWVPAKLKGPYMTYEEAERALEEFRGLTEPQKAEISANMNTTLFSNVQPGDVLIARDGFDCMVAGHEYVVERSDDAELYIPCARGKHFLLGQRTSDGRLSGLNKKEQT